MLDARRREQAGVDLLTAGRLPGDQPPAGARDLHDQPPAGRHSVFHQLQRDPTDRMRNRRVNERTNEEVPPEDIAKAYDTGDAYVIVEPSELDEIAPLTIAFGGPTRPDTPLTPGDGAPVYGAAMSFTLPSGLPPGRFVHSGPARVWPVLLSKQRARGLVPLPYRPDAIGEPLGLDDVDAVRLEEVLATDFAEYRRTRLPAWTDPTPAPVPEGIEPWPHDPGPPFEQWPGVAGSGTADACHVRRPDAGGGRVKPAGPAWRARAGTSRTGSG
ncbi:Ku protein [Streptomyces sp. NPDC004838]